MKAEELRIGNYVLFAEDGTLFQVHEISHGGLGVKSESELTWIEIETFQGVPITEEWLLKFGFSKLWHLNMFEYVIHITDLNIEINYRFGFHGDGQEPYLFVTTSPDELEGGSINSFYIKQEIIKYVHQLQNLYFSLTGEELTS